MDKTGPQSVYGQAEGQGREQVPSNSKGQSVDEPEDATTRMLKSAGTQLLCDHARQITIINTCSSKCQVYVACCGTMPGT